MQPDALVPKPAARWQPAIAPAWRGPLVRLGVVLVAIFALTLRDWAAMADQWWNVSTYSHVLFVGPIAGYLVWLRRSVLEQIVPQAWWPGLIAMALALLGWLLGTLAGINTLSQAGAVGAMQGAVLAVLGPRVVMAILFPLAYLAFLVPFGDELVPALQMITAKLVIVLTEWSGIEAQIEGVFIDTPAGLFEVAEACSGVKFLVAMAALGVLVAATCFASWKRRIAFLAAAMTLPILANAVRAWGTIAIAQVQGIEFAVGFDHIFYGWVFFALVVAALLAGAWRWFDADPEAPPVTQAALDRSELLRRAEAVRPVGAVAVTAGVLALSVGAMTWASLAMASEAQLPDRIALPDVPGWERTAYAPQLDWRPRAGGADHRLLGRYRDAQGRKVDVFYALYTAQDDGREASAPGEGALIPQTEWRWLGEGPAIADARNERLFALGSIRRTAQTHYRLGSTTTGSALWLKLAALQDRLLLRGQPTAMLILSAEAVPGGDPDAAIAAFHASLGGAEGRDAWMDRIAAGR